MPNEPVSFITGLWSAEERLLFDSLRPHCTTSEIAEIFRLSGYTRTVDAVDRRGRRTGIKFLGFGQPNLEELTPVQLEAVERVLAERSENNFESEEEELSGQSLLAIREPPRPLKSPGTDEIRSRLREIAAELPGEYPILTRPLGGSTAVLLLSDLHFGKVAEGFNMAAAHERIITIPERLDSYLPVDCNEVIVLLAGDLVEGEDIYPNQNCHVEVPLIEQVYGATRAIWLMLNKFSAKGRNVKVYTCPGNHGRMSKTANEKSNWDNVVYQELSLVAEIARNPNINVNANYEEFCRFPIRDKWGLMYHQGTKHTGTASMQVRLMGWLHTKPWDIFCLKPGAKIALPDGTFLPIEEIKAGQTVLDINGLTTQVEKIHPVRQIQETVYTPIVKGLPNRLSITATGEHPFLVTRGTRCILPSRTKTDKSCHPSTIKNSYPCTSCTEFPTPKEEWITAKNLEVGDYISIPVPRLPENPINNPDLGRLLGYYLAEGHLLNNRKGKPYAGVVFSLHRKEKELRQDIAGLVNKLFSLKMHDHLIPNSLEIQTAAYGKNIAIELEALGGRYSDRKKLSEAIWSFDKETRLQIIKGWILGDGAIRNRREAKRIKKEISATTVSPILAHQMYLLALSVGLRPFYRIGRTERLWKINPSKPSQCKACHIIEFYGNDVNAILGNDSIKTTRTKYSGFFHNEMYFMPIKAIRKETYSGPVYNFKTSSETYVAGLVNTHNCHGHHHTWSIGTIFGRPVVANGSLPGPDDLAERMGVTDPPRQAYYFARDNEPFFGFGYLEWA